MSIRRFYVTGFNADENEYEIRYPAEQQYASIDKDSLIAILEDYKADDREFIGGLRYRAIGSVDKFTSVDKRDIMLFLSALKGEAEGQSVSKEEEPEKDPLKRSCFVPADCENTIKEFNSYSYGMDEDVGTLFRFCCHPMMKAMLGGEGHVLISLDTGRIQLGNEPMNFCPFCGKAIRTFDPPIEVIPPEE